MKINSVIGLEKQRFFAADGEFASSLDVLKNELNISKRLRHPNIASCLEIIHGNDKICTINELGTLGQIMEWRELEETYVRNAKVMAYLISKYKTNRLGDITRIIFVEVCQAIKYLHSHNITNRDIKVDNIIARETEQQGNEIMVIDFTTVRYKKDDDISYFPTGTPGFRAPEHQFAGSDGYSCKATDVWSVGIAMWTFYHQRVPFPGEDDY
jgi:calcium/calmodulin-dependent protein kinase kinase 2